MAEIKRQSTEIKITVPWGHVAAKTYGSPTEKSVLMLHGFLDNAGSFDRLIQYLPTNYYYVCIDLPGHGLSSPFPSWQTIDFLNFVHVIQFILETLQWETCICIGHSLGAQLAVFFSILQPHRIEKIIAIDGMFPITALKFNKYVTNLREMFASKGTNNIELSLYTKEEVLYALKYKRFATLNSDAANALFERAVTEVDGKYKYNRDIRLRRQNLSLMTYDQLVEVAHEISVPFYFIIPIEGMIKNPDANYVYKIIQAITFETRFETVYVEGNHDIHNNDPEKVAPFVYKFLNNNENRSKL